MNFKDEYRAANEQIHGDRTILAGITEKPKKIIYFKPAVGVGIAAAVCAVTLLAYPYINPTTGNEESPSKTYSDVFVASEQEQGMPIPEFSEDEQTPATFTMRKTAPETVAEPDSQSVENSINTTVTQEEATENPAFFTADEVFEDSLEEVVPDDANDKAEPEAEKQMVAASGSAGGGGSSAKVKYTFSEDFSAVVFCDATGTETRCAITAETLFVNGKGAEISREQAKSGVVLQVEAEKGIALKIIME